MATGSTLFNTSRAAYNRPHVHIGHKTTTKANVLDKVTAALLALDRFEHENRKELAKAGPTDTHLLGEAKAHLFGARRKLRIMITK